MAFLVAGLAVGFGPVDSRAQVTIPSPHCEALVVELQGLRDEVDLYPGKLIDPPYVYRAWTHWPRVVCLDRRPTATLRILDRALSDETSKPDPQQWSIELMPAVPTSFELRLDGGSGHFDLTGMQVRSIDLFAVDADARLEFKSPNRQRLEDFRVIVDSGDLQLGHFLNANATRTTMRLPHSRARVELRGEPPAGATELEILESPQSLKLEVPRGLPLRVEGPPGILQPFAAAALRPSNGGVATPDYETADCRVLLRFAAAVPDFSLQWVDAIPIPETGAHETTPAAPSALASEALERRFGLATEALEAHNLADAQTRLRELRQQQPSDARLPVLERWASTLERPAPTNQASDALRVGLRLFLLGEYTNALAKFEAARADTTTASLAEAWIGKTESELQRLRPTEPPAPRIVERVVTETTAPVFALRSPPAAATRRRAGVLEVAGQVGDDIGVGRIEATLNGTPLQDAAGGKLQLLPGTGVDPRRMPFSFRVPLREGDNEIVVTAYDTDRPPHWTSEHLVVTRLPPWHRTPAFLAGLVTLLCAPIVWLLIGRGVKSRIAFVNRYNPYIAGLPIRDGEMLFGRERLLRSILNTIHNNSIMLYGPRRIGKTSLLLELKRQLERTQDGDFRFAPVFIDLQGTPEASFFATIMSDILEACRHLQASLPAVPDGKLPYSSREFTADLRRVLSVLQARTDKRLKLVLLLDEVDELNKYSEQTNQKLRGVFMKTFAESLVAVMSGTHIEKRWRSEGSPWYNFFEEVEVRPLEREDAIRLIRTPVHGIFSYEDAAIENILSYSECRPYVIQRFCVHAINRVIEARRRRVRVQDVEAVREQAVAMADAAA